MGDYGDIGKGICTLIYVLVPLAAVGLLSFIGGAIWFLIWLFHHVHWAQ